MNFKIGDHVRGISGRAMNVADAEVIKVSGLSICIHIVRFSSDCEGTIKWKGGNYVANPNDYEKIEVKD